MAINAEPLFVADKNTLKQSLRLGAIVDSDAADDILNDAMLKARSLMIRVLGDGPVQTLIALPTTASPTTRQEVQRVTAEQLEVVLTKRYLIPDLPTAFMDDSGGMIDTYNREAPFRLTNSEQRNMWVEELKAQSNDLAGQLISELRSASGVDELSATTELNGVGAVLLSPGQEAPTLDAREGHITTASYSSFYATPYTRHRLWHR